MSSNTSGAPAWRSPKALAIAGVVVAIIAAVLLLGRFGPSSVAFLADGSEEYCADLKTWNDETSEELPQDADEQTVVTEVAKRLSASLEAYENFADIAPDEVQDEWKLYSDRWNNVFTVAEEAGFDLTDPATLQQQAPPEAQAAITEASNKLTEQDTQKALDTIIDHAKETCDVDISKLGQQ